MGDSLVEMKISPTVPRKICIAGNIGAGKSTLSKSLAQYLEFELCEEPSDTNPYLEEFYNDKSLSFKCQIAFLAARFAKNKEVLKLASKTDTGIVQDRSCYEDVIFGRLLHESGDMDERDYETYMCLFDTLIQNLGSDMPDLILWLDVNIDTLFERVQQRGREFEKGESGVTRDYLVQLMKQYERFAKDMAKTVPVFKVNWDTFLPVSNLWDKALSQYDGKPGLKDLKI